MSPKITCFRHISVSRSSVFSCICSKVKGAEQGTFYTMHVSVRSVVMEGEMSVVSCLITHISTSLSAGRQPRCHYSAVMREIGCTADWDVTNSWLLTIISPSADRFIIGSAVNIQEAFHGDLWCIETSARPVKPINS